MNRDKILKMVIILALLCAGVWALSHVHQKNSMTLQEYAEQNPELAYRENAETDGADNLGESTETNGTGGSGENAVTDGTGGPGENAVTGGAGGPGENAVADGAGGPGENAGGDSDGSAETLQNETASTPVSTLTGAVLNGDSMLKQRITYADSFYYEPLSDNLKRYITGVSFPANSPDEENPPAVSYEDLYYLHILHYDFDGNPAEGELICNIAIAQELVEIFYELYRSEYQLESVLLIDEFDGNDTASMEANNTSCFNYRAVEGSSSLSKHALGLAVDINPLYNPYVTYEQDGSTNISPAAAMDYADRSASFPYKIDEEDLCYKLFTQHGFTWGGNWNSCKDYQHFQKTLSQ